MQKKIAVVILNFNGEKWLEKFLPSVCLHSPQAEVVVADNASTDASLDFVRKNFQKVVLIALEKNYGFAEGYNQALEKIKGNFEYYLLLNSDVEVSPNWLVPILEKLDQNKNYAALQPKILAYHQPDTFEHAGAAGGFIDTWGFPFCRGRIFETVEKDQQQYDDTRPLFWASGAAMAIRSELFHRLGGFDGDFFAHMEEIDLCWRLQNAGFQIGYVPQSCVFHVGGGTLAYQNPRKTYLNFRNNLLMLIKNLPAKNLFFKIFFRMVLDGIAGIHFGFQFKFQHVFQIIKAHFYLYQNFRKILEKRKTTQKIAPARKLETIYPKSIVWAFFVKGKKTFSKLNF
ncbi:glycosyltransferase family 2 protein [Hugenholtzia roseola]|uniref:glycosyltransferase family 2 protein n=1 Tax=Hugenholtzia roseola TaxID=1002 RepID=UPI00042A66C0|nr:glycosyltransferase family 2 protein [Hugenholtzia roseola]